MLTPEELEQKRQELEQKRRLKRERRRRRMMLYGIAIILSILLGIGTAYYTYNKGIRFSQDIHSRTPVEQTDSEKAVHPEPVNILVLGIDERPEDPGRTDTMILASIDPVKKQVALISLPRDTRVRIPGRRGYDRLNAAHVYGGPELAMAAVSEFLEIPVDYYVRINFDGFEKLIDILGGVEIDVEQRMKYDDYAGNLHIDLYPGRQVLNGADALAYVRFRSDGLGDISLIDPAKGEYGGRIVRQQKFINALIQKVVQPATISKLPSLALQLHECVTTNLPVTKMISLALHLRDLDSGSVVTAVLPGTGDTVNGVAYWIPNEDATRVMVDRLIRGLEPVTIQVLNGSGAAGAAGHAAERLREQGFPVLDVRDAQRFGYRQTEVIVTPDRWDVGAQIAQLFDAKIVDRESVENPAWGDRQYDVMVIVGENFSPSQF